MSWSHDATLIFSRSTAARASVVSSGASAGSVCSASGTLRLRPLVVVRGALCGTDVELARLLRVRVECWRRVHNPSDRLRSGDVAARSESDDDEEAEGGLAEADREDDDEDDEDEAADVNDTDEAEAAEEDDDTTR